VSGLQAARKLEGWPLLQNLSKQPHRIVTPNVFVREIMEGYVLKNLIKSAKISYSSKQGR
jgi:hypothetical protein